MFDVALSSAGSQVVLATSHDDRHPPENIIDGLCRTTTIAVETLEDAAIVEKKGPTYQETSSNEVFWLAAWNTETFWVTTGMFPQEFIVTFAKLMNMKNIELSTHNVRKLCIERSVQNEPADFEPLKEIELDSSEGQLQMESLDVGNVTATHLRVVIESGHDHFVSVHKLHVDGAAVPN